jgi:catalase-peroxidase
MGVNQESWGAHQWQPKNGAGATVPDAHNPSKSHAPFMLTVI